jgi:hypothetical protein
MPSAILRDFLRLDLELEKSVSPESALLLERLLAFATCLGVKVGGQYKHFKGDVYKVVGLVRDCEDWDGEPLVQYVAVHCAEHAAVRKLSDFLGDVDRPDYRGPRFRLLEVR